MDAESIGRRLFSIKNFVQRNYTFIAVLPFLIGGGIQCYKLLLLDFGYIRFFSPTQVLQDGLVFVSLAIIIFIIPFFAVILYGRKGVMPGLYAMFIATILLYGPIILSEVQEEGFTPQNLLSTLIIIFPALLLILSLLRNWLYKFKRGLQLAVGIILSFMMAILFYVYLLAPRLPDRFSGPLDLGNYKNIACLLQNPPYNAENYEILYFNDNHIFVEMRKEGQTERRIFPFEILYDPTPCEVSKGPYQ